MSAAIRCLWHEMLHHDMRSVRWHIRLRADGGGRINIFLAMCNVYAFVEG